MLGHHMHIPVREIEVRAFEKRRKRAVRKSRAQVVAGLEQNGDGHGAQRRIWLQCRHCPAAKKGNLSPESLEKVIYRCAQRRRVDAGGAVDTNAQTDTGGSGARPGPIEHAGIVAHDRSRTFDGGKFGHEWPEIVHGVSLGTSRDRDEKIVGGDGQIHREINRLVPWDVNDDLGDR